MAASDWRPIGRVDQQSLWEARAQAYYATQWLARAARAYVPPRAGDAHTNFGWDAALDGLTTHELRPGLRLGVGIAALALDIGGETFGLDGRTDADARVWLGAQLRRHGLDPDKLDAPSPWKMPRHPVGAGGAYRANAALAELAAWFANANVLLNAIRARHATAASPVRCWPHHFDIATLIRLDDGGGEHGRSVNVGMLPCDEHYGEPYFYVSPWPYPEPDRLPPLPAPGRWHAQHFTAAVAMAGTILAAKDPRAAADAFLSGAIETAIGILGPRKQ